MQVARRVMNAMMASAVHEEAMLSAKMMIRTVVGDNLMSTTGGDKASSQVRIRIIG